MKKTFAAILAAVMIFFGSAHVALAQWDYSDYTDSTYDYDTYSDEAATAAGGLFAGMSVLMIGVWCCVVVISLGFGIFRLLMIINAIKYGPEDQKMLWVLLMVFVPFVDWVYFFTKKKEWDPKLKGSAKKEETK